MVFTGTGLLAPCMQRRNTTSTTGQPVEIRRSCLVARGSHFSVSTGPAADHFVFGRGLCLCAYVWVRKYERGIWIVFLFFNVRFCGYG
jgi:hypothetical protein